MIDAELMNLAGKTLDHARRVGAMIVTAESCTGGLVAGTLTAVPGSSDVVFGGYVTYANEAKVALGVDSAVLAAHGAVSEAVARALAQCAQKQAMAAAGARVVSVAVTGVAGPGGGSSEKPVGLVHFAAAGDAVIHKPYRFGALDRSEIRRRSVIAALQLLGEAMGSGASSSR
ncbi:MAG: nicotinamide-nucleotide amidohydrolase family protein [Pseudomonadota bacterium]